MKETEFNGVIRELGTNKLFYVLRVVGDSIGSLYCQEYGTTETMKRMYLEKGRYYKSTIKVFNPDEKVSLIDYSKISKFPEWYPTNEFLFVEFTGTSPGCDCSLKHITTGDNHFAFSGNLKMMV